MNSRQVLHFGVAWKSPTLINRQRFPLRNCVIHSDALIVTTASILNFQFTNQHPPCCDTMVPTIVRGLRRHVKFSALLKTTLPKLTKVHSGTTGCIRHPIIGSESPSKANTMVGDSSPALQNQVFFLSPPM